MNMKDELARLQRKLGDDPDSLEGPDLNAVLKNRGAEAVIDAVHEHAEAVERAKVGHTLKVMAVVFDDQPEAVRTSMLRGMLREMSRDADDRWSGRSRNELNRARRDARVAAAAEVVEILIGEVL